MSAEVTNRRGRELETVERVVKLLYVPTKENMSIERKNLVSWMSSELKISEGSVKKAISFLKASGMIKHTKVPFHDGLILDIRHAYLETMRMQVETIHAELKFANKDLQAEMGKILEQHAYNVANIEKEAIEQLMVKYPEAKYSTDFEKYITDYEVGFIMLYLHDFKNRNKLDG